MSSLQKFHRRTQPFAPPPPKVIGSEAPIAGSGFYIGLAGDGTSYMYVAPKSTEVIRAWGSFGTVRGANSQSDGLANTNTLYAFGSAAHPAAYYCKSLTTGGYNTWYHPAIDELTTMYSKKNIVPFSTTNTFAGTYRSSSTEADVGQSFCINFSSGYFTTLNKGNGNYYVTAVRRAIV
jgi:hypothetical protein